MAHPQAYPGVHPGTVGSRVAEELQNIGFDRKLLLMSGVTTPAFGGRRNFKCGNGILQTLLHLRYIQVELPPAHHTPSATFLCYIDGSWMHPTFRAASSPLPSPVAQPVS